MKTTTRLLTLTSLLFFLAAWPGRLVAADCTDPAAADGQAVLRKLEHKIAMAQYEKLLASLCDAQLEANLAGRGIDQGELSSEEKKQSLKASMKVKILEQMRAGLRAQIFEGVREAGEVAAQSAREAASKNDKPK